MKKEMTNRTLLVFVSVLGSVLLLLSAYSMYMIQRSPRIAYVRNAVFAERYAGMKDARKLLEDKLREWENNVDTLEARYMKSLDHYNKHYATLKVAEREELKNSIDRQDNELRQYMAVIEKKVVEENQRKLQGLADQVNLFIKKYAEKHKYDLILGVSGDGNIVYGSDAIDLTDQILEALNNEYIGE
jgi:outer membrane protein